MIFKLNSICLKYGEKLKYYFNLFTYNIYTRVVFCDICIMYSS